MENNSKMLAMTMFCVLTIAVASNASSGVQRRALGGEDKGHGNSNESEKVASSPPPISHPNQNAAPTALDHTLTAQPSQSLPNSDKSDSSSSKSPPLMDSSIKTVPPPGPENLNPGASKQGKDNTSLTPTNREHKATESAKKVGDKPVQSPRKEDHTAPQDPEKRGDTTSQAPTKDNVPSEESKNESCETANASIIKCHKGELVACLLQSGVESTQFFLLVQNTGADDLNVNLKSSSNIKIDLKSLNLPKHSNKKVNLTADSSRDLIISLNAGEGENCVLQTKSSPSGWFQPFPSYPAQVGPVHVAYFLFAAIVIVGGTWTCFKFGRKQKRVDAGIPYQQLEMATHAESASMAANETPGESWDHSWDDDWDDEEAVVRTAGKQPAESVPSNGLSSRSANPSKDGWEIDWEDE